MDQIRRNLRNLSLALVGRSLFSGIVRIGILRSILTILNFDVSRLVLRNDLLIIARDQRLTKASGSTLLLV